MSAVFAGDSLRATRVVMIGCCIACVAFVLGVYTSLGEYFLPTRWYAYTIVALLFSAILFLVGNTPRVMAVTMILTLPMSICFSVYSRNSEYRDDSIYIMLNAFDIAAVVLILLITIRKLTKREGTLPPIYLATTLPFIVLAGISALSVGFAGDQTAAVIETIGLLRGFLLYVAVLCFARNKADFTFILDLLVLLLLTSAFLYIIQASMGYSFDLVGRMERGKVLAQGVTRLKGVNASGGAFACLCTLVLARLMAEKRPQWRLIESAALLFGLVALIYTLSRGSWISFGVGFCSVMFFGATKKTLSAGGTAVIVCIAGLVLYAFGDMAMERITTDDRGAGMSRVPLMKQALYIIAHNPVLGVGAGNYSSEMKHYVPEDMGRFWEWTVHNDYLLHWAECGTVGFAAFLWFLWAFVRSGLRALRFAEPRCANLGLMSLGFAAAIATHMFVESHAMNREVGQVLSMLLALAAVAPGVWGRSQPYRAPQEAVSGALTRTCRTVQ